MKIVAIIPARGGSKGIPRKNVKLLAGKPLVAYSIEAGLKSKYIDRVVVSTEDEEIAKVAKDFGAEVIKRPIELAQDETKTAPVLIQVVDELEKLGYIPDVVVLLQPTSPLRDEKIIDAALEKLFESKNDSIFTGFRLGESMPLWNENPDGSITPLYDYHLRPRRQEKDLRGNLYCEDGAVYAVKLDSFRKTKDFLGENPTIYLMKHQVDIDTPEEFEAVEKIILKTKGT